MPRLILSLLLIAFLPSCSDHPTGPKPATGPGQLVVYIYGALETPGSPNKRVEVVETGAEAVTDTTGIVEFTLDPGNYTVLAHEITGSISTYTAQRAAVIRSTETTRVEIHDCVLCLAP